MRALNFINCIHLISILTGFIMRVFHELYSIYVYFNWVYRASFLDRSQIMHIQLGFRFETFVNLVNSCIF